jgi:phytoene desaturase
VFFPKGGTGALVGALVKLFIELGGEIRFNSEVTEIMTGRSQVTGVVTQKGRKEGFDLVISNADVFHTYDVLLKREPRAEVMRKKVSAMIWALRCSLPTSRGTSPKTPLWLESTCP